MHRTTKSYWFTSYTRKEKNNNREILGYSEMQCAEVQCSEIFTLNIQEMLVTRVQKLHNIQDKLCMLKNEKNLFGVWKFLHFDLFQFSPTLHWGRVREWLRGAVLPAGLKHSTVDFKIWCVLLKIVILGNSSKE